MGTFAPLLFKVLGREYSFSPVLFGLALFNASTFYCNLQITQCLPLFCQILNITNSCFQVLAEAFRKLQNSENSLAARALPRTLLGELTTVPKPLSRLRGLMPPSQMPPSSPHYAKTKVGAYAYTKFLFNKTSVLQ